MEKNNVIEIHNLSKIINDITILNDISVNFEKGKIYGIVGTNGSGKSMMFKAICGLINSTKGEIKVFDEVIKDGSFPKSTEIIIESPGFLPQYSGFKNLKILASINNVVSDEDIKNVISLVGLEPNDKRAVKKYSLGMKQRLGIAQALMEKPKLLILDEPMNGLDEDGVKLIRDILLGLKKESVTILLASHNKEDINELCDKVYRMKKGVLSIDE
ncbi:ABC transporter ATP-binding protein [Clostridium botulinum]|uniref:Efflux ABC transporter, ATP-binding protein n=2 Tax=Clostridium botulinum TaxID=1491 RepID=A0A9N7G350_CLOBO|nr:MULTISPECIES: ABC transporter ATP-binding protein [Clostridium]ACT33598.1 efflux ABC transporter, ATP-binding protein [Clostridium botulinum D str. 1873]MBO3442765.1 ABC transporter ATP-binding protein [Clostridium haemolyticum]NFV48465.1 ABC transporter ATP-binding protein [Clostridium botulinum]QPW56647.1 ABC transporter ATP-binding protein [Clostridium botulinum]BAH29535.1 putative ABC transporter,ATP-binding protein [Clostridium botulinum]